MVEVTPLFHLLAIGLHCVRKGSPPSMYKQRPWTISYCMILLNSFNCAIVSDVGVVADTLS